MNESTVQTLKWIYVTAGSYFRDNLLTLRSLQIEVLSDKYNIIS